MVMSARHAAAALAVAALAACSSPALDTPPSTTGSTTGSTAETTPTPTTSSAPGSRLALPTATPITPSGRVGTPSTVPPPPPAPTGAAVDYSDPVAVARAWMTQWCPSDYREPVNNNIERAQIFATPAGKASDLARGNTAAGYRSMIEQKLSGRCDRITAEISPEAPRGPSQVYVVLTADRTQLAADVPFQVVPVTTTRSVIRQPDGRWLVDVHVDAG